MSTVQGLVMNLLYHHSIGESRHEYHEWICRISFLSRIKDSQPWRPAAQPGIPRWHVHARVRPEGDWPELSRHQRRARLPHGQRFAGKKPIYRVPQRGPTGHRRLQDN